MQGTWKRWVPFILLIATAGGVRAASRQQVWQADLQIRTLEVTRSRAGVSVRVVVYTEHDDEAKDARLLILLPVGVGVERMAAGCAASAGPSMVPSLRATVACELGGIVDKGFREVLLSTTLPAGALPKRFGVFAYSATPDPDPGNNYAERRIP
jgi:hypothetical protein